MKASTVQSLLGRNRSARLQGDIVQLSPVPLPQLSRRKSHVATLFAEDFCHGFDGPTGPHDTGLGLMESHPYLLLGPNRRPTVADLVLVEDFIGHA